MARMLVAGLVLVAVGFAAGLFFGMRPGAAQHHESVVAAPVTASAERPSESEKSVGVPIVGALVCPPPRVEYRCDPPAGLDAGTGGAGEIAQLRFDHLRLLQELASVRAQLDATRRDAEATQGRPVEPPADLPARFGQDAIRSAVTAALAEAGLAGAITSIDCTEFPCILYGEGKGGPEEFKRLMGTNAMRPYTGDSHNAFGWSLGDGTPDHPRRDFLGLALYPKPGGGSDADELRKRLKHRTSEMVATFDRR